MNTSSLLRSVSHPPDTEDLEVLTIPVPSDRRALALSDRLSLRIGLWLLLRAQRPRRQRVRRPTYEDTSRTRRETIVHPRESLTMLSSDLHRQWR